MITKQRKIRIAEVVANEINENGDAVAELPFARVRPAPSTDHAQPAAKPLHPGDEKAYRVRAPVQKDGLGKKLANQALNSSIEMTLGELVGVAPDVRESLKAKLTKTRQPIFSKVASEAVLAFQEEILPLEDDEEELKLEYDALSMDELPQVSSYMVSDVSDREVPLGSIMIPDPYMQYLESLGPDEIPKQVYVARDSASLRVVYPMVNNRGEVESVTDSGSQIVSMSLAQARVSKLSWDPDIQIFMQSANNSLEKSVGLARNVPFKFGPITVYLQAHIINGPAYKILLGRPFDILTESTVQNSSDGSQTITLKDPNTGKRCTMPTHSRGKHEDNRPPKKATVESVPDEDDPPATTADSTTVEAGFRQSSRN